MRECSKKRRRLWDNYSGKYNELSDKIVNAGIDVKLLRNVIDAHKNIVLDDMECKIGSALKSIK